MNNDVTPTETQDLSHLSNRSKTGLKSGTMRSEPNRHGCLGSDSMTLEARLEIWIVARCQPARIDYEYSREGTGNLFIFYAPHYGWRHVEVTPTRTKQDFAYQMQALVEVHFPRADKIRVVLDNLNTHTPAALYETFLPQEARRILNHLEFHYTPKHGSWLNQVEIEISVLSRQCLERRIPDVETLRREISAWSQQRNQQKAKVAWRFAATEARAKFQRLYPAC